jgi:hypothetical protein
MTGKRQNAYFRKLLVGYDGVLDNAKELTRSLSVYCALLCDWCERTLAQVQRRFDTHANSYCALVERLVGGQEMRTSQDEDSSRRDLESLKSTLGEETLAS